MTGPPGEWHVTGEEALVGAPDDRQPRRPVPLQPRRPDHRGPRWSRRSRSSTPTRTSSSSPSRTCSTWRTAPGCGARPRPGSIRLRSSADALRHFPQLALATVLLAAERARRASGTAPASSWSGSPPTAEMCCSSTPTTRPRSARPARSSTSSPHHGTPTRRCPARPGTALRWLPGPALVPRRPDGGDSVTAQGQSPRRHDGRLALHRGATAIASLLSRRQSPGDLVYEDGVQRAYNHLVLRCLLAGTEPPASVPGTGHLGVPDAARRVARRPAASRAMSHPRGRRDPHAHPGLPGVGAASRGRPAELFENQVIDDALAACRAARSPGSYTAFRRLLITRPVLTATELAALAAEIDLMPVFEVIRRCYEPAPAAYLRDGAYSALRAVRLPPRAPRATAATAASWTAAAADGGTTRGAAAARADRGSSSSAARCGCSSPAPASPRPTWRRHSGKPGLPRDVAPVRRLRPARPLPGRHRVGRRREGLGQPVAARQAGRRPLRADPPHDRAFIVVPAYRFRVREDYARAFRHALARGARPDRRVLRRRSFARQARRELRAPGARPRHHGTEATPMRSSSGWHQATQQGAPGRMASGPRRLPARRDARRRTRAITCCSQVMPGRPAGDCVDPVRRLPVRGGVRSRPDGRAAAAASAGPATTCGRCAAAGSGSPTWSGTSGCHRSCAATS